MIKLIDLKVHGWERIVKVTDETTNLLAFVSIHSTKLGPAIGGCRMYMYKNEDDALYDANNLSLGMTYKNALALDGFGGGKTTVIGDPKDEKAKLEKLKSLAEGLNKLDGSYYTAQDSGLEASDLIYMKQFTKYAVTPVVGGKETDPSPYTAYGVFRSIIGCCYFMNKNGEEIENINFDDKSIIKGKEIIVTGLGHVGYELCRLLHENGAKLYVNDIDDKKIKLAKEQLNATYLDENQIKNQKADIFAPCALGGAINESNIELLNVKAICGGANNQLKLPEYDDLLREKKIIYCPDYVVNSAGVMTVAHGINKDNVESELYASIDLLSARIYEILARAKKEGKSTNFIANSMVNELLEKN